MAAFSIISYAAVSSARRARDCPHPCEAKWLYVGGGVHGPRGVRVVRSGGVRGEPALAFRPKAQKKNNRRDDGPPAAHGTAAGDRILEYCHAGSGAGVDPRKSDRFGSPVRKSERD